MNNKTKELILALMCIPMLGALLVFAYFKISFLIKNPSCFIVECRQILEGGE